MNELIVKSDIAFYGINLNQSLILKSIGYGVGKTHWQTLYNTAIGNIIVAAAVCVFLLQTKYLQFK